jgi:hypothetical protein
MRWRRAALAATVVIETLIAAVSDFLINEAANKADIPLRVTLLLLVPLALVGLGLAVWLRLRSEDKPAIPEEFVHGQQELAWGQEALAEGQQQLAQGQADSIALGAETLSTVTEIKEAVWRPGRYNIVPARELDRTSFKLGDDSAASFDYLTMPIQDAYDAATQALTEASRGTAGKRGLLAEPLKGVLRQVPTTFRVATDSDFLLDFLGDRAFRFPIDLQTYPVLVRSACVALLPRDKPGRDTYGRMSLASGVWCVLPHPLTETPSPIRTPD